MMSYDFPVLDLSEILVNLDQLFSIQIDEKFLKKPEPVQWQRMLSQMLLSITGCSEDTFLRQQRLTTDFEHVELHTESIPLMHLILALRTVMQEIACPDFNAGVIFKPTPLKVQRICSALINATRFKMMRMPYLTQIREDGESERESYGIVQKEIENQKQRINQIQAQRAEQEPRLVKVKEEIEATHQRMNELGDRKAQAKKETTNIKRANVEQNEKNDEMKNEIMKRKDDVESLSQKIIQSPTKVKAEHENLGQQLERLETTQDGKRQRIRELSQMIGNYEKFEIDTEKGSEVLEAINDSVNKENEIVKEIGQFEDKVQDLLQQHNDMNRKKKQIHESNQSKQDKLVRLSCQHQSRMSVLKEQQELLEKDKDCYMKKQDSFSANKNELMQYKRSLDAEGKNEEQMVEQRIDKMKDMYSQLLATSEECHTSIDNNWQKTKTLLKKL